MPEETAVRNAPRQPSLYIPHGGGPCFFMEWTWGPRDTWEKTRSFLEGLAATLPAKPKAILVATGHWEEPLFVAGADQAPGLYFDYYGFPEETYRLQWPAPGAPELAHRVVGLLREAGLPAAASTGRGYDHGVFIPLKVAFPEAEIPIVPLSLALGLDPAMHLAAGRALEPLREEGVLILGSGMSFHNQRAYLQPATVARSRVFDAWLERAVGSGADERAAMLSAWEAAPEALFCHPRAEHLLPLMVAAGAAGEAPGRRIFGDEPMGAALSGFRFD